MIIDHIGIVVKSITQGIIHWQKVFGYSQHTEIVLNTRQQVKIVFMTKKNSLTIKLVEADGPQSPVYEFGRKGGGLHHLCFKCNNVATQVLILNDMGLRTLAPPQPGEAFKEENIAFVFAKQGLNIELIDTEKRAKIIL